MSFPQNTYRSSLSDDNLLFMTLLTGMYNDNIRQINTLTNANNQIRNAMLSIINRANNTHENQNQFQNQNQNQNSYMQSRSLLSNIFHLNNITNTNNTNTLNRQNRSTRLFDTFFEPVYINPTPAQIEAATRNVRFGDILSPMNTTCPISLETFNDDTRVIMIRHCGHLFNTEEINVWFRTNCRCPICRYDIRSYNPSRYQNNQQNQPNQVSETHTSVLNESEGSNMDSDVSYNTPITPVNSLNHDTTIQTPHRAPLNRRYTNLSNNNMSDDEYSRRLLLLIFGENGANNVSDLINGFTMTRE
jgi:hypothetical protein